MVDTCQNTAVWIRMQSAFASLGYPNLRGILWLLSASVVWGIAFVPQKLAADAYGALWSNVFRFAIAAPFAFLLARGHLWSLATQHFRRLVMLGLAGAGTYALQTWALSMIDVSRVALWTGLYVAFVPLLAPAFGWCMPRLPVWLGIGMSLLGMALVVMAAQQLSAFHFRLGDAIAVGAAVLIALQINLVASLATSASPWALNCCQIVCVAFVLFPLAVSVEPVPDFASVPPFAWFSLVFLAVFASVFALGAQFVGQRGTTPAVAGVVMLLEVPVGAISALIFFQETMSPLQVCGSALVLLGLLVTVLGENRRVRLVKIASTDGQEGLTAGSKR